MGSLLLITTVTVLYSEGWRLDKSQDSDANIISQAVIKKTGMIAIRSVPDSAKVYIDGELVTATDDTISALTPGTHQVEVKKEGFEPWAKAINVYPELVTDITAVLVLQSPRLEPLTNTDVKAYALSNNQNNIAFLTANHTQPGIWMLPLSGTPLNIFRNNTRLLIADTVFAAPSLGQNIWWSPDDKEILVQMNATGYLLYKVPEQNGANVTPKSVTKVYEVKARWNETWKTDFLVPKLNAIKQNQDIPELVLQHAQNETTTWSPDDEKFFFLNQNSDNSKEYDLVVYNSETPLPVSEERLYSTIKITNPENIKIYWYSDSYHLILVEKVDAQSKYYTVSLIRIDGSNRTTIYTGTLDSDQAYTTPQGDKIVVMTSLKDGGSSNLYAISIR